MHCNNCPRSCRDTPSCSKPDSIKINTYQLHYGEEPSISGIRGSGTIFFSHCNMHCIFCQNYRISQLGEGYEIETSKLVEICFELQSLGAHNINFVTPTPYADKLIKVIKEVKRKGLEIPIVWNCGGYESLSVIKRLRGLVDIYLPDFKYSDESLSVKYSSAPGYVKNICKVIPEMRNQVIDSIDSSGVMRSGIIIRHLVLPNHVENSKGVLKLIRDIVGRDVYISLMSQYCPMYKAIGHKILGRRVSVEEYKDVCRYFTKLGFHNGFLQGVDSATHECIPNFKSFP